MKKVEEYVLTKRPEFRSMLGEVDKLVDRFPSQVSDRTYYRVLTEIQAEQDTRLRETGETVVADAATKKDDPAFEEEMQNYMSQLSDFLKTRLAQYVVHRKIVLKLLEQRLFVQADGKHAPEKLMHETLFPMRKTSNDSVWGQQNLWVFDERLCYHEFLASDKEFRQIDGFDPKDKDRADIVVFGAANVFGENPLGELHYATIIEFKRPEREKFSFGGDDDPIDQVQRYVEKIRHRKEHTFRGRTIEISSAIPIACYIICDLPAIEELAKKYDFDEIPRGGGFFYYHKNLNAYIEIIAWQRLLKDAQDRNRVLFQKLVLLD